VFVESELESIWFW